MGYEGALSEVSFRRPPEADFGPHLREAVVIGRRSPRQGKVGVWRSGLAMSLDLRGVRRQPSGSRES